MPRLLALPLGLALGIVVFAGPAAAQETVPGSGIVTNADGANVSSDADVNPTAIGDAGTVVYGDITSGPGGIVIGPPVSGPVDVPAPPVEPGAPAAPTGPVPTATDADGDSLADDSEAAYGTDPFNIDTDGDQIDDGYELNGLGTNPLLYDTDGDGLFDGQEVYGTFTDPLSPNAADAGTPAAAFSSPQTVPAATSTQPGVATTLGPGAATAAPGSVTSPSAGTTLVGPTATCAGYASWYDAQLAFEAAGGLSAAPDFVTAFDPDYDGIACEERM